MKQLWRYGFLLLDFRKGAADRPKNNSRDWQEGQYETAAPIMWFFVCEGYYYTHDVKKYMLRMGMLAVISHFAYCFAFGINPIPFRTGIFNQTSVMYPLFIAVLILWMQDHDLPMKNWVKNILIFALVWSAFPADWSCIAVLAILEMYKKRGNLKAQMKEVYPIHLIFIGVLRICIYGDVSLLF